MKYTYLSVISIILLMCGSCEDILDKLPKDRLSPETYFSNAKELELYTNGFYTIFPKAEDLYSESVDVITTSQLPLEIRGARLVPDKGQGWEFVQLRRINFLLSNISNCSDIYAQKEYTALARFFRAYFYFEKVKQFGDVPWYNKVLETNDPDLYKPRDSRFSVMDSILSDINYAIVNLPSKKHPYRISKWTALALKSRICLFEGTFRKYHNLGDYENLLTECAAVSEDFILNSGYKIYKSGNTPYHSLFAALNANEDEIILARNYDGSLGLVHNVNNYTLSPSNRPGLTKKMVNSYLKKDGTRFTDQPGYETFNFVQECADRDPRLAQTIRTPGYKRISENTTLAPNIGMCVTGYQPTKFVMESIYDAWNKPDCDFPLFRTAEVYLNFAEAKAELETLTQNDLNISINKIRDRVEMPPLNLIAANTTPDPYLSDIATGYPNVSGINKGVILEIRRERTIELIMEGFRYYDIIRWKAGKTFEQKFYGMYFPGPGSYDIDGDGKKDIYFYEGNKPSSFIPLMKIGTDIFFSNGNSGYIEIHGNMNRVWDENKDYLYPIPIQDRILSSGKLTQNPGWIDGLVF